MTNSLKLKIWNFELGKNILKKDANSLYIRPIIN